MYIYGECPEFLYILIRKHIFAGIRYTIIPVPDLIQSIDYVVNILYQDFLVHERVRTNIFILSRVTLTVNRR